MSIAYIQDLFKVVIDWKNGYQRVGVPTTEVYNETRRQLFDIKFYPHVTADQEQVFAITGRHEIIIARPRPDAKGIDFLLWITDDEDGENFNSCVWSQDIETGTPLICVAGLNKVIKIFDAVTGRLVRRLAGHGREINDLAVSPINPEIIVSVSSDRTARVWNINQAFEKDPTVVILTGHGHTEGILTCAFHANGRYLLTGGFDNVVCLWTLPILTTGSPTIDSTKVIHYPHFKSCAIHKNYVDCVQFYGDLVLSRSAEENMIVLWEINGFSGSMPVPEYEIAPALQTFDDNKSSFADEDDQLKYTRRLEFLTPHSEPFYIRFSLLHQPGAHPILVFGNCKSQIRMWDLHRLKLGIERGGKVPNHVLESRRTESATSKSTTPTIPRAQLPPSSLSNNRVDQHTPNASDSEMKGPVSRNVGANPESEMLPDAPPISSGAVDSSTGATQSDSESIATPAQNHHQSPDKTGLSSTKSNGPVSEAGEILRDPLDRSHFQNTAASTNKITKKKKKARSRPAQKFAVKSTSTQSPLAPTSFGSLGISAATATVKKVLDTFQNRLGKDPDQARSEPMEMDIDRASSQGSAAMDLDTGASSPVTTRQSAAEVMDSSRAQSTNTTHISDTASTRQERSLGIHDLIEPSRDRLQQRTEEIGSLSLSTDSLDQALPAIERPSSPSQQLFADADVSLTEANRRPSAQTPASTTLASTPQTTTTTAATTEPIVHTPKAQTQKAQLPNTDPETPISVSATQTQSSQTPPALPPSQSTQIKTESAVTTTAVPDPAHPILSNPWKPITAHKTVTHPTIDFCARASGWSVGGEWCVVVGDCGMICLFRRGG